MTKPIQASPFNGAAPWFNFGHFIQLLACYFLGPSDVDRLS